MDVLQVKNSKLSLSTKLFVVTLIGIGFAPWSVSWLVFALGGYLQWAQIYTNEEAAWSAIFCAFPIAALLLCIYNYKKARTFCMIAGTVALLGTIWGLEGIGGIGRASSKMDEENLTLLDFWLAGGWLAVFFVGPFIVAYLAAVIFEKAGRRERTKLAEKSP